MGKTMSKTGIQLETVDLGQYAPEKRLVEPGDMALVLKQDGSVQLFQICIASPNSEQTVADMRTAEFMKSKLTALAFAATSEPVMTKLIEMTVRPEVGDSTVN